MNFYLGNRRSMASSSTAPAATPVKDDFPEALTYRYNDNSAWVPAARSHDASCSPFCLLPLCGLQYLTGLFGMSGCAGGY
jgi:hypothetical protein